MFKQFVFAVLTVLCAAGAAFAQVDVNKADQAALDGIKGIGPAMSKTILNERQKGGNFKDWSDFEERVRGISEKKSVALSAAGLNVNGAPKTAGAALEKATARKTSESASAPK